MKTLTRFLCIVLPIITLASASTARAGHDRSSRLVCELERETDHLLKDLKHAYRHRGHATCRHSAEGRFYRAIKEVEEQADTLHSRIRKNRSMGSRAEAFRAIRCAYDEARELLHRVDLDCHIVELVRKVGRRIDELACAFDEHGHNYRHAQSSRRGGYDRDHGRGHDNPYYGGRFTAGHVSIGAGATNGTRIDSVLLAQLLHAFGR